MSGPSRARMMPITLKDYGAEDTHKMVQTDEQITEIYAPKKSS